MIKANELRLGSWYNFANPMEGGVLHPEQFTAWNQYLDFEAYGEPIPLTPEILEKCGAKKSVYPHFSYLIEIGEGDRIGLHEYIDGWSWFPVAGRKMIVIKHLHQLQNIYFALTGEELIYNPATGSGTTL
jgi:hypothetical protein